MQGIVEFALFFDCKSLRHVTIGSGIETIGERAFESCSSIAPDAFAGCRSDLMIYGYQETAAERYAAANGYYFALAPVG